MSMEEKMRQEWAKKLQPLVGRRITQVRYMGDDEMTLCGWSRSPVTLTLDDGTLLWPSSDDEGNDAGALQIQTGDKTKTLPEGAPVI
jgi:hypothetical protein